MRDLFHEELALKRIELVTRLVSVIDSGAGDEKLAVNWVAEMSADLLKRLDEHDEDSPQEGGGGSGSLLQ